MIPTLLRKALALSRLLLVRVLLIALLAIVAIGLAKLFGTLIPEGLSYSVGAGAVDGILSIIANSMLTVTVFTLTVIAATHRSVAGLWTPRAHQILLQDTTTQNVLATFVGAYLYALMAIVLRESEVFSGDDLVVLFAMTILVVVMVVVAIIRWISHLEMFGSLIETGSRIEQRTRESWALRGAWPCLGGHPFSDPPADSYILRAESSGYLQQIFQDRLQAAAEQAEARIWLCHPVGQFVYRGAIIARTDCEADALAAGIRHGLSFGTLRNYEQDPEFGLLSLSEIGSRALSSGINDPGTAIDMLQRMSRIAMIWPDPPGEGAPDDKPVKYDRLYLPRFDLVQVLDRVFSPLARDGAGYDEVMQAYDSALAAMATHPDPALQGAAAHLLRHVDGQG